MTDPDISWVGPSAAPDVLAVVRAGFGARPPLDPPSTALDETPESVERALADDHGVLVRLDGEPAATLMVRRDGPVAHLSRVAVHPHRQSRGIARAMVSFVERELAARGVGEVRITARPELPATVRFWERQGYLERGHDRVHVLMSHLLPVSYDLPDAAATRTFGMRLASLLTHGDVVILTGELGAGKTTLTQGIGAGLDVRGAVTSPTFVISRVHRSHGSGPLLTHVDAYRLGDQAELDDLDIDAYVEAGVTVVEWGDDIAENLAADRLHVHLGRTRGDVVGPGVGEKLDPRIATLTPVGLRWFDVDLTALLG